MAVSEQPAGRHELKFVFQAVELPWVNTWVRTNPACFISMYPQRMVTSTYFDTGEWDSIQDNLAGLAERWKLRMRWYGESVGNVRPTLELKRKKGLLGFKELVSLDFDLDLKSMRWAEILRRISGKPLGPLTAYFAAIQRATVINRYRREYLISMDRSVRLTLDTELIAFDQSLSARPNLNRPIQTPAVGIVELKADASKEARLRDVASCFPLRFGSYSKYVNSLVRERI